MGPIGFSAPEFASALMLLLKKKNNNNNMPTSWVFGQHVTAANGVNGRHLEMVIGIIEKSLHVH